ncbi:YdeI/OmpD-associated family protein [Lysobacter tyrosinilyticus]
MGQRDPRIDAYIARSAEFARPILGHLRELVHAACPECEETLKWSAPSFTYRGKILCGMAAFKQHATFGFWQGAMVMGGDGKKLDDAMGQFGRLTRVADLPGKRELTGYLRQAMRLIEEGVKRPATKDSKPKPAAEVPDDLGAALKKNAKARATFDAFPPSCKREYIEWIIEAKREETRSRRLEQTIEWLVEGKRRNWKYESC